MSGTFYRKFRQTHWIGRTKSAIAQYEAAKDAYDSIRYNPAQMYGLNDQERQTEWERSQDVKRTYDAARAELSAYGIDPDNIYGDPSFLSRVTDTLLGGIKHSLASDANAGATVYEMTQGGRDTTNKEYLSAYEDALKYAQRDLAQLIEDGASTRDITDQKAVVADFQRKFDAISRADEIQRGASQAAYQLADDIRNSVAASISEAKNGLGFVGQTAVDVGATLTEMGLDKAKSALLIGGLNPDFKEEEIFKKLEDYFKILPLAGRNYGKNSQLARHRGANLKGATIYGATTAITDAAIEKAFDGLNGLYGEGAAKKLAKLFKEKFNVKGISSNVVKAALNDAGETLESAANDVANQMLKSLYNGKSVGKNFTETEWYQVARSALVNAIIGLLSGDEAFYS